MIVNVPYVPAHVPGVGNSETLANSGMFHMFHMFRTPAHVHVTHDHHPITRTFSARVHIFVWNIWNIWNIVVTVRLSAVPDTRNIVLGYGT